MVNVILSSPIPSVVQWGSEMLMIYNDGYRAVLGGRHPKALGQSAHQVWKEVWRYVGPQFEAVLATGQTTLEEHVLIPLVNNGSMQDFYWNYVFSPIYEEGVIAGILNTCMNVTDAVITAHKLRESEARSSQILQSIGDAVIVTDADTRISRMNPAAERLTGWPLGEAQGRPLPEVFRIVNETAGELIESPADKVKRLGTIVNLAKHTVLISRDGNEIQIDDSEAPIRTEEGEITGAVLVFRNIEERRAAERERKQMEHALRESDARFNAIYSTTLEYIGLLTPDGTILDCNRASLEFAGNKRQEVIGMRFWESPWFANTPGAPELLRQSIARAAAGESVRYEALLLRPSGESIAFDFSLSPVRNSNGDIVFLVPEGRDITELKRAEVALLQSEKLAAVGRLAASIAHEINNPLESVTNLLYLARTNKDAREIQGYLDIAERELRRVSVISNQTLRFYKQSTHPQAVTCADLMDSVLSIYQGRIVNSRISVEKRKRASKSVVCFEGEIRQVLNNLVGNAIDAMHPDGGRLLLRSREATNWKAGKKGLMLTVADTGCGISRSAKEKIFEPFFTTKGIGGTGLGLWVSREIADRHHGALRVRSNQLGMNRGTVFTLFLPFDSVSG